MRSVKLQGDYVDWTGLIIIRGKQIKVGMKLSSFEGRVLMRGG